jgi:hypothetical protein
MYVRVLLILLSLLCGFVVLLSSSLGQREKPKNNREKMIHVCVTRT